MSKVEQNKALVGRWFTEFWGPKVNLSAVDELAAPDMLLQYPAKASDFNKSQQLSANADRRPSLGPISDFHPQIAIRERARLSEGATRSNVEFPAAVGLESYPVRQAILYNHQL